MSKFMILFVPILAALIHAIPLIPRDVYDPPITYPNAQTVWQTGETQTVTWDTSGLPPDLPNLGQVILGFLANNSENLMLDNPLATGFKLTDGQVPITVPDVPSRADYIIVLMGDSGNTSPEFTIQGSSEPTTITNPSETTTSSASSSLTPSPPADVSSTATSVTDALAPTTTPAQAIVPSSSTTPSASISVSALSTPSRQSSAGRSDRMRTLSSPLPYVVGLVSLLFWRII